MDYVRDGDQRFVRIDEHTFLEKATAKTVHRCVGCYKKVSFREFDDNKGYCSACRDGKNEAFYRP